MRSPSCGANALARGDESIVCVRVGSVSSVGNVRMSRQLHRVAYKPAVNSHRDVGGRMAAPTEIIDPPIARSGVSSANGQRCGLAEMKARQVAKMREIHEALLAEGCISLDHQAAVLGLSRSTTWTIINGNHKCSGLSVTILSRVLSAPHLPQTVRKKVLEYIKEKCAGYYGGSEQRLREFANRVKVHEDRASGERSPDT